MVKALLLTLFVLVFGAGLTIAADLTTQPAVGQWLELPNTKIRTVLPVPTPGGNSGPTSITVAWNGAALDSKRSRLIIWGGGHGDYFGNEIYALDLHSQAMVRLTDPSPYCNQAVCTEFLQDGQPTARHTYDGLTYVPETDQFMSMGGALSPCGNGATRMWLYSFGTSKWLEKNTLGQNPDWDGNGQLCVYDPVTKNVYFDDEVTLSRYTVSTNTWAIIGTHAYIDYHLTAAIDTKRRKMVTLGDGVRTIDLTTGAMTTLATTNAPALASNGQSPGIAYDPVADRIVAWHGGNTVYVLNLDTKQWTSVNPSSGPGQAAPSQGTWGRWAYVPEYGVFAMVNSIDMNGWVFRLEAGTSVEKKSTLSANSAAQAITLSPNPFKTSTAIGLPAGSAFSVKVFDLSGKEVADLSASTRISGMVNWRPEGLSGGVYILKVRVDGQVFSKTLLYQK